MAPLPAPTSSLPRPTSCRWCCSSSPRRRRRSPRRRRVRSGRTNVVCTLESSFGEDGWRRLTVRCVSGSAHGDDGLPANDGSEVALPERPQAEHDWRRHPEGERRGGDGDPLATAEELLE